MKARKFLAGILSVIYLFTCCKDAVFGIRIARLGDFGTISQLAQHLHNEYGMSTHDLTADILAFNGISWEQARHLNPDTKIKLPPTKAEYEEAARKIEQWKNEQMALIRDRIEQQKKEEMEKIRADLEFRKEQLKQKITENIQKFKEEVIQETKLHAKQDEEDQIQRIKDWETQKIAQITQKKKKNLSS